MRIQPKKIMCAVDFSIFTEPVLTYSIALCQKFNAKLCLAHVTIDVQHLIQYNNETSLDVEELQKCHIRDAQNQIEYLSKDLIIDHELFIRKGEPADEITRLALEKEMDMVITTTHGKSGVQRFLIGSVTEKLMKTLHCPLLVLHAEEDDGRPRADFEMNLEKILVGCDFSTDSTLAHEYSLSLAQEFQAELHLAHVIKPTDYKENQYNIRELRNKLDSRLQAMVPDECRNWCTPKTALLDGEPYKELMNYAKENEIEMIILGIRGHTLWEKLLVGSTTDRVIRHAPCPVLAVRH